MQYSKINKLLTIIPILFSASCASKINIVEGDEVYLQNTFVQQGTQTTYLQFSDVDGHAIENYYYKDDLSKKYNYDMFKISSGIKIIQLSLSHTKNTTESLNLYNTIKQIVYSQNFEFKVTTRPKQTYSAVVEIKNDRATVWLVNSTGFKVTGSITKRLMFTDNVNEGINYYYYRERVNPIIGIKY